MQESEFRTFLKKSGKKEHVIEGLISHVWAYEAYLENAGQGEVDTAGEAELCAYLETLDPGILKKRLRGLALYYRFLGKDQIAQLASAARQAEIHHDCQAFKLREFRGVNLTQVSRLEAEGIKNTADMLGAGRTPAARLDLAERTGLPLPVILELVKLSDLSRLAGVKGVRARLYYDAGIDTPARFLEWDPEDLRRMLVDFVESTGFPGIAPLRKELSNAISTVQHLPQIVEY